jgi:hypothetical protein
MRLFSRRGDPILDVIARDTFALFPRCHRCGERIAVFEDAEVRVLVLRVVHRGPCPALPATEAVASEGDRGC